MNIKLIDTLLEPQSDFLILTADKCIKLFFIEINT